MLIMATTIHRAMKQHYIDNKVTFPISKATFKCSVDVIIDSINKQSNDSDDIDSILIAKTRIPKTIKPGVIRIRLVSSLFSADIDVHEEPFLIKLETIRNQPYHNHFDKQFAIILKINLILILFWIK
ncbi:unnamed protein product [Rotaria socialis]|uniref:Uncharacterized protein n=2 Tax=Rotaria socialis TaxID=392032 RepID=A0A818LB62_9BILA|nr:unnamed protein product [Rotaria socialis]